MFIWRKIRPFFRSFYRLSSAFNGFFYDFKRFFFYSGWKENLKDNQVRNYNSAMVYHGLEKSLSYKKRNPNSGWANAEKILHRLSVANENKELGYHDKAAKDVLFQFLNLPENKSLDRSKRMLLELEKMVFQSNDLHGALHYSINNYEKGILEVPEDFFFSRYSLREFSKEVVPNSTIKRAVHLAMKTPSVCNRQAWHIFHSSEEEVIQKALSYQSGNRPFGKEVKNLMIITTDLKAFFAGSEHYQHWIDGGMMSMSIIYALHSLGVASCPLNWSQTPQADKALRKALKIENNQTVIMMIAVGYPEKSNIVCRSSRRPFDEVFSKLELR